MDRRNESRINQSSYRATNIAGNDGFTSTRPQLHPTIITTQQRSAALVRHQPHYTGYDRSLESYHVCRCANPRSHGDAYSHPASGERSDGIPRRDLTGRRMTGEEEDHRLLDALGKDYASRAELYSVRGQIYHPDTLRALNSKRRNADWARARGLTVRVLPHDAIWHGRVNPKGCRIDTDPASEGACYVGANGAYRPGPTASAQGTRLQGRSTTLGLSWGASQFGNRGR
jgi:hypothetical protein